MSAKRTPDAATAHVFCDDDDDEPTKRRCPDPAAADNDNDDESASSSSESECSSLPPPTLAKDQLMKALPAICVLSVQRGEDYAALDFCSNTNNTDKMLIWLGMHIGLDAKDIAELDPEYYDPTTVSAHSFGPVDLSFIRFVVGFIDEDHAKHRSFWTFTAKDVAKVYVREQHILSSKFRREVARFCAPGLV
jgi:hypothetical protein